MRGANINNTSRVAGVDEGEQPSNLGLYRRRVGGALKRMDRLVSQPLNNRFIPRPRHEPICGRRRACGQRERGTPSVSTMSHAPRVTGDYPVPLQGWGEIVSKRKATPSQNRAERSLSNVTGVGAVDNPSPPSTEQEARQEERKIAGPAAAAVRKEV
jgi:hypothetical protein